MARKKTQPVYVEPEEETQEVEETEPEFSTEPDPGDTSEFWEEMEKEQVAIDAKQGTLTKAAAARAAIAAGYEKPGEAVDYIKREFSIDMAPQHFSAIKSQIKKQAREDQEYRLQEPVRRGRKPASVEAPIAAAPKRASNGEAGLLEAMEAMKPLVEAMGAERVKRLVDLLG